MKKHHIILVFIIVGVAAYFLNETRKLGSVESTTRAELDLLRAAVKKSTGTATVSTVTARSARPPAIDSAMFISDLAGLAKMSESADSQKSLQDFLSKYQSQITSAPFSKLKEICELLEKSFSLDQADSELARRIWLGVVGMAAKSDPEWAFAKFDEVASTTQVPIDAVLATFKNWASHNDEPMSFTYAWALNKWLDAAQAAGRFEEGNTVVTELRAGIAAAQGNLSAAIKEMAQLPYLNQRKAAIDYVENLQTPRARRQAMEELSNALHIQNFPYFVRELVGQQGFDAAKDILGSASLTPEKHDLAAASIAAANIGPETPAKAKWLMESLRSDDKRAILEFTNQWTHADYQGAAQWLSSLPEGKQRDVAISGFASVAAKIDGATAVDWALTLSDPNERGSCVDDVVREWRKTDAEAANVYLKEKGLPVR